jgi:hypothetical protein
VAELPPDLVRRLTLAIANVAELIDGSCLVVFGPDARGVSYDGRTSKDGQSHVFAILAGTRAILTTIFQRALPAWIADVKRLRDRPMNLVDGLVVPDPSVAAGDQKPAALAGLIDYIALVVEAHVEMHPEDEALVPVLTDAMIDDLFKA